MESSKALFLDRDGVINKEINYLYRIEDFVFIDGIFDVCRHFIALGYKIIIVTNQAGIARGYYTKKDFGNLNLWMLQKFKEQGIYIDKVYYCPHHPDGIIPEYSIECNCRKPKPGMLISAKEMFNIDVKNSILVGDKESDIEAGINAGISKNILVRSGHPINEKNTKALQVIDNIRELDAS